MECVQGLHTDAAVCQQLLRLQWATQHPLTCWQGRVGSQGCAALCGACCCLFVSSWTFERFGQKSNSNDCNCLVVCLNMMSQPHRCEQPGHHQCGIGLMEASAQYVYNVHARFMVQKIFLSHCPKHRTRRRFTTRNMHGHMARRACVTSVTVLLLSASLATPQHGNKSTKKACTPSPNVHKQTRYAMTTTVAMWLPSTAAAGCICYIYSYCFFVFFFLLLAGVLTGPAAAAGCAFWTYHSSKYFVPPPSFTACRAASIMLVGRSISGQALLGNDSRNTEGGIRPGSGRTQR